jgi:hypothetical protein
MSSTHRLMIAVSMAGLLGLLFLPVQATASHVQCGDEITQDTTLDSDVLGCSSPLTVTGNAVTLNLNGHILEGGISMHVNDVDFLTSLVIENGTVRNGSVLAATVNRAIIRNLHADGIHGIFVDDLLIEGNEVSGESSDCGIGAGLDTVARILNNEVRGCPSVGVSIAGLGGTFGRVEGNVIERNGVGAGFGLFGQSVTLQGNTIRRNTGDGVTLGGYRGAGLTATGNRIADNGGNGVVTFADTVLLKTERNVISGNAENGIGGYPSENMVFRSTYDVISHNGLAGIEATPPEGFFTLLGAAVSGNGTDGIHLGGMRGYDAEITDSRADRNGDDGIDTEDFGGGRVALTHNHAWFNGDLGIEAVPGVIGGGNWAKHNGNPLQCLNVSCSTKGKPKN